MMEVAISNGFGIKHLRILTLIQAAGGVYDFQNFEQV
jgi:hypothetical protein